MLGSMKSASSWKWAAFGKHPVAGDYFHAGPDDPFFQAFSGWVENGYRQVCSGRKHSTDLYSWRFWANGYQKDSLMCGVVRDSFDAVARPYPLVVMGTGVLPDWMRQLALLPFALEKSWIQMEYLAMKRYIDFSQMENDIRRLPVPDAQWPGLQNEARRREACRPPPDPQMERIWKMAGDPADELPMITALDNGACRDVITAAGLRHAALTGKDGTIPNAVFLGGVLNAAYLAVFRKPLRVPDFIRLWSVGIDLP